MEAVVSSSHVSGEEEEEGFLIPFSCSNMSSQVYELLQCEAFPSSSLSAPNPLLLPSFFQAQYKGIEYHFKSGSECH